MLVFNLSMVTPFSYTEYTKQHSEKWSTACISLNALLGTDTDDYGNTKFHHAANSGNTCWRPQLELTISGLSILTSIIRHSLRWKFQPNPWWTIANSFWSSGDFVFKLSVILGKACSNHVCEYTPCRWPLLWICVHKCLQRCRSLCVCVCA